MMQSLKLRLEKIRPNHRIKINPERKSQADFAIFLKAFIKCKKGDAVSFLTCSKQALVLSHHAKESSNRRTWNPAPHHGERNRKKELLA